MLRRDLFATFRNAEFNLFKKTSPAGGRCKAENDSRQTHTIRTILLAEEAEEEQERSHVRLGAFFVEVFHP
jgi:hypothetical protein